MNHHLLHFHRVCTFSGAKNKTKRKIWGEKKQKNNNLRVLFVLQLNFALNERRTYEMRVCVWARERGKDSPKMRRTQTHRKRVREMIEKLAIWKMKLKLFLLFSTGYCWMQTHWWENSMLVLFGGTMNVVWMSFMNIHFGLMKCVTKCNRLVRQQPACQSYTFSTMELAMMVTHITMIYRIQQKLSIDHATAHFSLYRNRVEQSRWVKWREMN